MVHLPDGFYIPLHNEEWDKFLDHAELKPKKKPQIAQKKKLGIKGKLMIAKKISAGKAQMKKTLAMHEESSSRRKVDDEVQEGAVPAYLLDCEQTTRAKPKGVYIELHNKTYGRYLDHDERKPKKECQVHKCSQIAQKQSSGRG